MHGNTKLKKVDYSRVLQQYSLLCVLRSILLDDDPSDSKYVAISKVKVKVKQSHYMPGQVCYGLRIRDFKTIGT